MTGATSSEDFPGGEICRMDKKGSIAFLTIYDQCRSPYVCIHNYVIDINCDTGEYNILKTSRLGVRVKRPARSRGLLLATD